MEIGFGITALPARAKSPNCKAGDGTAELRQVLSSELGFPEPPFRGGLDRRDGLVEFVDGYLDFATQVLVRKGARALARELGQSREVTAQPLVLAI